jgi:hypothetical protein
MCPTLCGNTEHLKRVFLRKSECGLQVIMRASVFAINVEVVTDALAAELDAEASPAVGRSQWSLVCRPRPVVAWSSGLTYKAHAVIDFSPRDSRPDKRSRPWGQTTICKVTREKAIYMGAKFSFQPR